MKTYNTSDYALNKFSNGIIYNSVDGAVEITIEEFLSENTDKSDIDFWKLKKISDEIYFEQDRKDNAQTKKMYRLLRNSLIGLYHISPILAFSM